jgi:hypothetical protein
MNLTDESICPQKKKIPCSAQEIKEYREGAKRHRTWFAKVEHLPTHLVWHFHCTLIHESSPVVEKKSGDSTH